VVREYDGALKGEHGTGRNIAPFVEAEWGPEALDLMRALKRLVDPEGLLNPGVILNADPRAHLADLKTMPAVEEEVDRCIECGYCESKCPSRTLTLTPRQRIVVRREMVRLAARDGEDRLHALTRDFPYAAVDTCAADGLCATACPVGIDTGQLVKRLRRLAHPAWAQALALQAARHLAGLEPLVRLALRAGHAGQRVIGPGGMRALTRAIRRLLGTPFPEWSPEMPLPARRPPRAADRGAGAVYFPSCISRVMGRLPGEPDDLSVAETLLELGQRAGVPLCIPERTAGTCCGVPFASKGYDRAHRAVVNRTIERLWSWSDGGRLPVVTEASPCAQGLLGARPALSPANQARFGGLTILDSIAFVHDRLLPRLEVRRRRRSVVLHPVCSVLKQGLAPQLEAIARACSQEVTVPTLAGCCGFAGDRGFLVPELTAAATAAESAEVRAGAHDGHFSSSRTCEVGLTRATGSIYRSYLYLLEQATRP